MDHRVDLFEDLLFEAPVLFPGLEITYQLVGQAFFHYFHQVGVASKT